jgi:hypothetical protein
MGKKKSREVDGLQSGKMTKSAVSSQIDQIQISQQLYF